MSYKLENTYNALHFVIVASMYSSESTGYECMYLIFKCFYIQNKRMAGKENVLNWERERERGRERERDRDREKDKERDRERVLKLKKQVHIEKLKSSK